MSTTRLGILNSWCGQFKLKAQQVQDHHLLTWRRSTFSWIDDFTPKFIEIIGNPSVFYVIDCARTHYDTQINEIIKISHQIIMFILLRHHQILYIHSIKHSLDESRQ